ncbi:hypothetical protein CYY_001368 [Polysphondylium violaceum]|uniref:NADH dehydrogenase [ubiquinone] 1 alpha subcomplex subunit 12 n=1 Tax=Polysphondylium violaceum TaxID=133409 RepID=A0A8J4Q225_9MYCE|nr:hypothetical protein CYY_001368 [Polysphondylium violaceum]
MAEIVRYCKGVLQRGVKESLKTLYYTGELKFGDLIGTDKVGNRYFENKEEIYGRHRWVEYANRSDPDPTTIPPEWHSWIHHMSDKPGSEMLAYSPIYKREHLANPTGTDNAYMPTKYLFNIEQQKLKEEEEEKKH